MWLPDGCNLSSTHNVGTRPVLDGRSDKPETIVSGHKFKIGQLVNYLGLDHTLPAFIRSLSYCRQKAKYSSIALRISTRPMSG